MSHLKDFAKNVRACNPTTSNLHDTTDMQPSDQTRSLKEIITETYKAMEVLYKQNLDEATEDNGVGYMQAHSYMNERFIKFQQLKVLSSAELLDCIRVLQYYRNTQIKWYTVTPADIWSYTSVIDTQYKKVKDSFQPVGIVERVGNRIEVKVDYHKDILEKIHMIASRKSIKNTQGKHELWVFPEEALSMIYSLFPNWVYKNIDIKSLTKYTLDEIKQLNRQNVLWYSEGEFRFAMSVPQKIREQLFFDGFRWKTELNCWYIEATLTNAAWILSNMNLELHPSFEEEYTRLHNQYLEQIECSKEVKKVFKKLLERSYVDPWDESKVIKPREFQKDSLDWKATRLWGHIDAHDMGLGKTLMSLLLATAIQYVRNSKVIVVCPAIVQDQWKKTAAMLGCEVQVCSWAKIPESVQGEYIVIYDEAHKMQDSTTKQCRAALRLAKDAFSIQLLTGTPCKNGRLSNVFPLLNCIKWSAARTFRKFVYAFTDVNGNEDFKKLFERTAGKCILYKHKSECIDLPGLSRIKVDVQFSKEDENTYLLEYNQFMQRYHSRVQQGLISGEMEFLVAALGMRKANSIGKVNAAVELADEILAQGEQLVIFAEFKETLSRIRSHLQQDFRVFWIEDSTIQTKREEAREAFLRGELDCIMCTTKTGGVGLNLQSACYVLLVDRPWTPGDTLQGEDRVNRLGQTKPVTSYWLQHGIDYDVDNVLLEKQEKINKMLGSNVEI